LADEHGPVGHEQVDGAGPFGGREAADHPSSLAPRQDAT